MLCMKMTYKNVQKTIGLEGSRATSDPFYNIKIGKGGFRKTRLLGKRGSGVRDALRQEM